MDEEAGYYDHRKGKHTRFVQAGGSVHTFQIIGGMILNSFFYIFLLLIIISIAATFFDFPRVISGVRERNEALRRNEDGHLNMEVCRLYYNQVSASEVLDFKKKNIDTVKTDFCITAKAYLDEDYRIQIVRGVLNYYAICEAGKCEQFFRSLTDHALYYIGALASVIFLFNFIYGRQQPDMDPRALAMYVHHMKQHAN